MIFLVRTYHRYSVGQRISRAVRVHLPDGSVRPVGSSAVAELPLSEAPDAPLAELDEPTEDEVPS